MQITKILTATTLSVIVSLVAGCNKTDSNPNTAQSSTAITKNSSATDPSSSVSKNFIQSNVTNPKAVYTMAVEASYPPYAFRDTSGTPIGLDIDMITAIANAQSVKINIVAKPWKGLFDELKNHQHDIVGSGVMVTEERKQTMDIIPFISTHSVMVYPNTTSHASFDDFKNLTIGVQDGSSYADEIKSYLGNNVKIQSYKTTFLALQDMEQGKIDGVFDDKIVINHLYHTAFKDKPSKEITPVNLKPYDVGYALRKNETALQQTLNDGLEKIKADGTYDKIKTHWLGNQK